MLPSFNFDFGDHYTQVHGFSIAFRVYSESNVYTPDPTRITVHHRADGIDITSDVFAWAGLQQKCAGSFHADLRLIENGFDCEIKASLSERIKGTVLLILTDPPTSMPTADYEFEPLATINAELHYPEQMRVPVFPLLMETGRYLAIANLDTEVRGKTVAVATAPRDNAQKCCIELHHHEDARRWSHFQKSPVWRVLETSDPQSLFEERVRIADEEWKVLSWEEREDVPPWAREIGLVLNLHGTHWTGHIFNTYEQQLEALRYVCQQIEGKRVLAFLAAWDGRYNYNWPQYQAAEAMGGAEGLRALVKGAHELGVHVIPQLGAVSANRRFLPPALHASASEDAFGNVMVKQVDWDYDRTPDTYRVNANLGHPGFRRFLFDQTCRLVEEFGFDGVFLDINMHHANDSRFNILEGHIEFARLCQERFDNFLLFGEHWYDGLLRAYPLVHSINQQGRGIPRRWPQCFERYARATYHLIHPAPGTGSTGVYEAGYHQPFVPDPNFSAIPAISFVESTLTEYTDEIDCRIDAAKAYIHRMKI
jgi:hypothetical protein